MIKKPEQFPENNYFIHKPVLINEVIEYLNIRPKLTYLDLTCGLGGHLQAISQKLSDCNGLTNHNLIGIDQDTQALAYAKTRLPDNVILKHGNFRYLNQLLNDLKIPQIDGGILVDLGVSSYQLANPDRGFSFEKSGPLDMRMDLNQSLTAQTIVNDYTEFNLARIIYEYGEEILSRAIAKAIVKARPLYTTTDLALIIQNCYLAKYGSGYRQKFKINPATKTFQAIRIEVNQELIAIKEMLSAAITLLAPKARMVVISFHGLEDILVKHFFRQAKMHKNKYPNDNLKLANQAALFQNLTPKPIQSSQKEILANTRARSAKLRAIEKI